jgi:hypothetical protein
MYTVDGKAILRPDYAPYWRAVLARFAEARRQGTLPPTTRRPVLSDSQKRAMNDHAEQLALAATTEEEG